MKTLVAVLAFLFCVVASGAFELSKPADWSQSDWEKFIEEGVQIGLGEALGKAGSAVPLVDVYSALSAFGNSTNTGLLLWLRRKQTDARINGDDTRADRYQDVETCLVTGDCQRLAAIQAAATRPPTGLSDISGHWNSNIGFEYDITQSGNAYRWVVTKGTPRETGEGTVQGDQVRATWSGTNGSGSVDGRVLRGGSTVSIEWSNGVRFFR
jgi:hypothetical protein